MKSINTILIFLKNFFRPAINQKGATFKTLFESIWSGIWWDLIPLFSIPYIIILINEGNPQKIFAFSIFIIFIYFIFWIVNYFITKWNLSIYHIYNYELENLYRYKILLKDNFAMEKKGTGEVQSIIFKGINRWGDTLQQIIYATPKIIIGIGAGIYFAYSMGANYLLLFVFLSFITMIGFIYFKNLRLKSDQIVNDFEDIKSKNSTRSIMSRIEILFSNQLKKESELIKSFDLKKFIEDKKSAKYEFVSDAFISGIGSIFSFVFLIIVIITGNFSNITTATLIAFVYFGTRWQFTMYNLSYSFRIFFNTYPQISKFLKFIDEIPEIKNYETGKEFIHGNGKIEFQNVNFSYDEIEKDNIENKKPKMILENLNLKIDGGTKTAIVGKSGSGKTTIAKLITGYLKIENEQEENVLNSGKVLVDDQDITELSLKSYYKYIGYLTQEPMVFDGSIRENLLYATESEVTEKEINIALEKAHCDFVYKLKDGLETKIGEKGIRLSGGERQRLAIAKLFLKNPEIIVLDEPTSALDSFSEDVISKSLDELFKNRTVIIIAHRLQTIKKADRILVLENGQIVEDGNHIKLKRKNGHYAKMLELQSGF